MLNDRLKTFFYLTSILNPISISRNIGAYHSVKKKSWLENFSSQLLGFVLSVKKT